MKKFVKFEFSIYGFGTVTLVYWEYTSYARLYSYFCSVQIYDIFHRHYGRRME